MHPTSTVFEKIQLFLRLTAPIMLTQFSLIAASFVAVFLTGRYGTTALAAVSIGYNIWIPAFFGLLGVLLGISPIIAQQLGARQTDTVARTVQQGLYISTVFALFLIILGLLFYKPLLDHLGLDPLVASISLDYMKWIGVAAFPLMWVCILRNTVDSHGYTHLSMIIMFISFLIGVLANYCFIFGNFGFPMLGGAGAGLATAISTWFNLLCYLVLLSVKAPFKDYHIFRHWYRPQWVYAREQLHLGVPIGISIFCEVSVFSVAGVLMTPYGTDIIAAHQATMSFTNLVYCFPLSISMASTIVVAYEIGAKQLIGAQTYAYIARGTALILAIILCAYSFTHMKEIASMYTYDPKMVSLIRSFLSYGVFFAVFDAFGTPIQGILRGYRDVRIISYISLGTYWGVSGLVAFISMEYLHMGPYGIWAGLLASVFVAAIIYTARLWYIQHKRYAS